MLNEALVVDRNGYIVEFVQVVHDPVVINLDTTEENKVALKALGIDDSDLDFAVDLCYKNMPLEALSEKYNENIYAAQRHMYEIQQKVAEYASIYEYKETEETIPRVLYYEMRNEESLVFDDIDIALSMTKPRWGGEKWAETASDDELMKRNRVISSMKIQTQESLSVEERLVKIESMLLELKNND